HLYARRHSALHFRPTLSETVTKPSLLKLEHGHILLKVDFRKAPMRKQFGYNGSALETEGTSGSCCFIHSPPNRYSAKLNLHRNFTRNSNRRQLNSTFPHHRYPVHPHLRNNAGRSQ